MGKIAASVALLWSSCLCYIAAEQAAPREQFTVTVQPRTTTRAHVDNVPDQIVSGAEASQAGLVGVEQSQIGGFEERKSAASAVASVSSMVQAFNAARHTLAADVTGAGGHYAQCSTVVFNECLGKRGQDTFASATARATTTTQFTFDTEVRPILYRLSVALSGTAASDSVRVVVNADDKQHELGRTGGSLEVVSGPRKIIAVTVELKSEFTAQGASPPLASYQSTVVDASLVRVPILEAQKRARNPRIAGGKEVTSGWETVGVLMRQDGKICTGTVVGPHTVLTAAHCVYTYEATDMRFGEGRSIYPPDKETALTGAILPPTYDDKTLRDDIALVYLAGPARPKYEDLHSGSPSLDEYRKRGLPLEFIGYGYEVSDDSELVGLGVKRHVPMGIRNISPNRFEYGGAGKNTCSGDSGGPAILTNARHNYVAGVTSDGDLSCKALGGDTRVDAYLIWLRQNIK